MTALHVLTGMEAGAREKLLSFAPILPMELCWMRRAGVWEREARVLMPGYLFLDTALNDYAYYRAKDTPGVIKILNYPAPLPEEEAAVIRRMAGGMMGPHVIDAAGNVAEGFFAKETPVAVHKRQRRAVFEMRLLGKKTRVTVSATFLQ